MHINSTSFIPKEKGGQAHLLISFINLWFWRSWTCIILFFLIIPFASMAYMLLYSDLPSFTLPSTIIVSLISSSLVIFPTMMCEIKMNTIIEKIFIFSKKIFFCNAVIFLYALIISLSCILWNLFICFLFSLDKSIFPIDIFAYVDWGQFAFSVAISLIWMNSIGSLIYTLIKSRIINNVVVLFMGVFCLIFAGLFIPQQTIESNVVLKYISYFSPARYATLLIMISMNSLILNTNGNWFSIFNFNNDLNLVNPFSGNSDTILFLPSYEQILNIFIPVSFSIIILAWTLSTRMGRRK